MELTRRVASHDTARILVGGGDGSLVAQLLEQCLAIAADMTDESRSEVLAVDDRRSVDGEVHDMRASRNLAEEAHIGLARQVDEKIAHHMSLAVEGTAVGSRSRSDAAELHPLEVDILRELGIERSIHLVDHGGEPLDIGGRSQRVDTLLGKDILRVGSAAHGADAIGEMMVVACGALGIGEGESSSRAHRWHRPRHPR